MTTANIPSTTLTSNTVIAPPNGPQKLSKTIAHTDLANTTNSDVTYTPDLHNSLQPSTNTISPSSTPSTLTTLSNTNTKTVTNPTSTGQKSPTSDPKSPSTQTPSYTSSSFLDALCSSSTLAPTLQKSVSSSVSSESQTHTLIPYYPKTTSQTKLLAGYSAAMANTFPTDPSYRPSHYIKSTSNLNILSANTSSTSQAKTSSSNRTLLSHSFNLTHLPTPSNLSELLSSHTVLTPKATHSTIPKTKTIPLTSKKTTAPKWDLQTAPDANHQPKNKHNSSTTTSSPNTPTNMDLAPTAHLPPKTEFNDFSSAHPTQTTATTFFTPYKPTNFKLPTPMFTVYSNTQTLESRSTNTPTSSPTWKSNFLTIDHRLQSLSRLLTLPITPSVKPNTTFPPLHLLHPTKTSQNNRTTSLTTPPPTTKTKTLLPPRPNNKTPSTSLQLIPRPNQYPKTSPLLHPPIHQTMTQTSSNYHPRNTKPPNLLQSSLPQHPPNQPHLNFPISPTLTCTLLYMPSIYTDLFAHSLSYNARMPNTPSSR